MCTPNLKQEGQQGQGGKKVKKVYLTLDVIGTENATSPLQRRDELTWAEHDADTQVQELILPSSPLPQNTEKTWKNQSLLLTPAPAISITPNPHPIKH